MRTSRSNCGSRQIGVLGEKLIGSRPQALSNAAKPSSIEGIGTNDVRCLRLLAERLGDQQSLEPESQEADADWTTLKYLYSFSPTTSHEIPVVVFVY